MADSVTVPAVERVLDIIEYLHNSGAPKTLKEMSEDLNIPMASLFRIVKNLTARQYLTKVDRGTAEYTLGYMIPQIASGFSDQYAIAGLSAGYLRALSAATAQTAQLMAFDGSSFFYIDQVLSPAPLQFVARLYTPLAINTSACAKCILSMMHPKQRQAVVEAAELRRYTQFTVTDKKEFILELDRIKEQGWASDIDEFNFGISCIGAPVFSAGNCIGAVGITGHSEDYRDPEKFEMLKEEVVETARRISRLPV